MEYLESGKIVGGRYQVEDLCGEGGMAAVYRVRHAQLDTLHALKVLTMSSKSVQRRLMQEGRVQAAINHPNILSVTDVVDVDGAPGLVMEFIRGPALDDFLIKKKLTPAQVDALAVPILDGVSAAHGLGLIHRDLKPANVMLAITPHGLLPKVADFGLVKLLADGDDSQFSKTRSGMAMGTPAYMAPEQIRDAKNVDARADIWSLGAILYEMCSGKRAFAGDMDLLQIFNKVASGDFPSLREVEPGLPERMYLAVEAAMTTDRDERVGSVADLKRLWLGRESVVDDSADDLLTAAQSMGGASEETSEFLKRSFRSQDAYRPQPLGDLPTALNDVQNEETYFPPSEAHKTAATLHPGVIGAQSAETLSPLAHPRDETLINEPADNRRRMGMALIGVGLLGALGVPVVGYLAYTQLTTPPVAEIPAELEETVETPEPAGTIEPATPDPAEPEAPQPVAVRTPDPVPKIEVSAPKTVPKVSPEPSGTTEPVPEPVPEAVPKATPKPEPAGTADAVPTVNIDSDVSVFLLDGANRRVDLATLEPGTYTVAAVFDATKPDEMTEFDTVTLGSGDTLAIKCVGSAHRCKVSK
ncbi:MAG: serine/threonine protein kinase [Deltaproteobacteria bacterium]|nr:MAG: serine/threonine protein kinase [Deltaproteobacteria bacterium]